jgi:uncharacterized protein (TIGR02266 family)
MSKVRIDWNIDAEVDGNDRRRFERTRFLVRVDYATVDEFFSEFTHDINEGGLFIETEKPHPAGTIVSMLFNLPGAEAPIQTFGTVVRISPGDGLQPPGMGIEFDELDGEARQRINAFVKALRSSSPAGFARASA